jgi:hypothetical protein
MRKPGNPGFRIFSFRFVSFRFVKFHLRNTPPAVSVLSIDLIV